MNQKNYSRRTFIERSFGLVGLTYVLSLIPQTAFAQAKLAACKPTDPAPAGLKYSENKKKVDKALQSVRNGVPFEKQQCNGCMFYVADKTLADHGKCQVIPTCLVKNSAWCNSWAKKA
jgi:hypothetical protein